MNHTSMNISLPETLKQHVQARVANGGYGTPSDYVRSLIREDIKRAGHDRLAALLMEGVGSGPSQPMTREDWQGIRDEGYRLAGFDPQPEA